MVYSYGHEMNYSSTKIVLVFPEANKLSHAIFILIPDHLKYVDINFEAYSTLKLGYG